MYKSYLKVIYIDPGVKYEGTINESEIKDSEYDLKRGSSWIGRNWPLILADNRVSRTHMEVAFCDRAGVLTITSKSPNPIYYKVKTQEFTDSSLEGTQSQDDSKVESTQELSEIPSTLEFPDMPGLTFSPFATPLDSTKNSAPNTGKPGHLNLPAASPLTMPPVGESSQPKQSSQPKNVEPTQYGPKATLKPIKALTHLGLSSAPLHTPIQSLNPNPPLINRKMSDLKSFVSHLPTEVPEDLVRIDSRINSGGGFRIVGIVDKDILDEPTPINTLPKDPIDKVNSTDTAKKATVKAPPKQRILTPVSIPQSDEWKILKMGDTPCIIRHGETGIVSFFGRHGGPQYQLHIVRLSKSLDNSSYPSTQVLDDSFEKLHTPMKSKQNNVSAQSPLSKTPLLPTQAISRVQIEQQSPPISHDTFITGQTKVTFTTDSPPLDRDGFAMPKPGRQNIRSPSKKETLKTPIEIPVQAPQIITTDTATSIPQSSTLENKKQIPTSAPSPKIAKLSDIPPIPINLDEAADSYEEEEDEEEDKNDLPTRKKQNKRKRGSLEDTKSIRSRKSTSPPPSIKQSRIQDNTIQDSIGEMEMARMKKRVLPHDLKSRESEKSEIHQFHPNVEELTPSKDIDQQVVVSSKEEENLSEAEDEYNEENEDDDDNLALPSAPFNALSRQEVQDAGLPSIVIPQSNSQSEKSSQNFSLEVYEAPSSDKSPQFDIPQQSTSTNTSYEPTSNRQHEFPVVDMYSPPKFSEMDHFGGSTLPRQPLQMMKSSFMDVVDSHIDFSRRSNLQIDAGLGATTYIPIQGTDDDQMEASHQDYEGMDDQQAEVDAEYYEYQEEQYPDQNNLEHNIDQDLINNTNHHNNNMNGEFMGDLVHPGQNMGHLNARHQLISSQNRPPILMRTTTNTPIIDSAKLQIIGTLGSGSCGEVYKANYLGTVVAVKKVFRSLIHDSALSEFQAECDILKSLRHPNIVLLMGIVGWVETGHATHTAFDNALCFVTEYMPLGSLHEVLMNPDNTIDQLATIRMATEAAMGMNCLHNSNPPVIHRDLKSHNLLVGDNFRVKVTDFGLAKFTSSADDNHNTFCGTLPWAAPEVLAGSGYSVKADLYSFGVVLWELTTRQEPYKGLHKPQIIVNVTQHGMRPPLIPGIDPVMVELMEFCWDQDPYKRPDFQDVVNRLNEITAYLIQREKEKKQRKKQLQILAYQLYPGLMPYFAGLISSNQQYLKNPSAATNGHIQETGSEGKNSNSVPIIPELFESLPDLIEHKKIVWLNSLKPGSLTHEEQIQVSNEFISYLNQNPTDDAVFIGTSDQPLWIYDPSRESFSAISNEGQALPEKSGQNTRMLADLDSQETKCILDQNKQFIEELGQAYAGGDLPAVLSALQRIQSGFRTANLPFPDLNQSISGHPNGGLISSQRKSLNPSMSITPVGNENNQFTFSSKTHPVVVGSGPTRHELIPYLTEPPTMMTSPKPQATNGGTLSTSSLGTSWTLDVKELNSIEQMEDEPIWSFDDLLEDHHLRTGEVTQNIKRNRNPTKSSQKTTSFWRCSYRGQDVTVKLWHDPVVSPQNEKLYQLSKIDFSKQLDVLSSVRSPRMTLFYGCVIEPSLLIVSEYSSLPTLLNVMKDTNIRLEWEMVLQLSLELARAIHSLHKWKPSIVHRDIQSCKFIVDLRTGSVKINDLGLARFTTPTYSNENNIDELNVVGENNINGAQNSTSSVESATSLKSLRSMNGSRTSSISEQQYNFTHLNNADTMSRHKGTFVYSSPEVLSGLEATSASDIYSLGIVLWELMMRCLTGVHQIPFSEHAVNAKHEFLLISKISKQNLRPSIPQEAPPPLAQLISSCWIENPSERPTSELLIDQLEKILSLYKKALEEQAS